MSDDLFSEEYAPIRKRIFSSIEEIETHAANNTNWRTRKKASQKPEAKVKAKIRAHLEKVYKAKVLRTNAGSITDQFGNTIYLGETGQSDLQAIIPIEIDGFTFGIFAAIEVKAGSNKATDHQTRYLKQVTDRGGIGVVASSTEHIDEAVLNKMVEMQAHFARR